MLATYIVYMLYDLFVGTIALRPWYFNNLSTDYCGQVDLNPKFVAALSDIFHSLPKKPILLHLKVHYQTDVNFFIFTFLFGLSIRKKQKNVYMFLIILTRYTFIDSHVRINFVYLALQFDLLLRALVDGLEGLNMKNFLMATVLSTDAKNPYLASVVEAVFSTPRRLLICVCV